MLYPGMGTCRSLCPSWPTNTLGHFGLNKNYSVLRESFYWLGMQQDLEAAYIPLCDACQQNKLLTKHPSGPLHLLPIPDTRGNSVTMDFVGPLLEDSHFNYLVTITDRLNANIWLIPTHYTITVPQLTDLFFDHWYCENCLPCKIISDYEKLFLSQF